jgi:DNA-binding transcriptional regulator GbsR (MarR family)
MIEIRTGSLQERVLRVLLMQYPITVDELQRKLHVSREVIMRVLKSFQTRNIVNLDILPDKTYIRLLRTDFVFVGRRATQRKAFKRGRLAATAVVRSPRNKTADDDYEDIMYR